MRGSAAAVAPPIPAEISNDLYATPEEAYHEQRAKRQEQILGGAPPPCYLCRYGNRIVDSGGKGSQLVVGMLKMVEKFYMTKSPTEMVEMIARFIEQKIRPVVEHAVDLPPVDRGQIMEHLTTQQHTINSRIALTNLARDLDMIMQTLKGYMFPRVGVPDFKAIETYAKLHTQMTKLHTTKVKDLWAGAARSDDINIELTGALASGESTAQAQLEHAPFMAEYLADHHAEAETDAVPTDVYDEEDG